MPLLSAGVTVRSCAAGTSSADIYSLDIDDGGRWPSASVGVGAEYVSDHLRGHSDIKHECRLSFCCRHLYDQRLCWNLRLRRLYDHLCQWNDERHRGGWERCADQ